MNVKIVKCKQACGLRWGVVSLGFTLLSVAHPIRDNITGTGLAPVDGSHPGPQW